MDCRPLQESLRGERMRELIDTLQARLDRIKYYKETFDNEEVIELAVKQLKDAEDYEYTQSDIDDAIVQGFDRAKERIIEEILKNPTLKKRGEMIEAVEEMEWNG